MNSKTRTIATICLVLACMLLVSGCDNIRDAAKEGNLDEVKKYIDQGVNVNERSGDGETALHWACREGHADVAHYLLSKGADVSEKGTGCGTPLQWAVQAGQQEMVILLLDNNAEINQHGTDEFTALHDAVINQNVQMVELLLARGADPNAKASYSRTPLFFVEHHARNEAIADLLRKHGAKDDDAQRTDTGNAN
jgi:ankyrin repeat protein